MLLRLRHDKRILDGYVAWPFPYFSTFESRSMWRLRQSFPPSSSSVQARQCGKAPVLCDWSMPVVKIFYPAVHIDQRSCSRYTHHKSTSSILYAMLDVDAASDRINTKFKRCLLSPSTLAHEVNKYVIRQVTRHHVTISSLSFNSTIPTTFRSWEAKVSRVIYW